MDEPFSFGYILRKYRRARDLTQGELARHVACAVGTIKKIEADERRPSKPLAERLAELLAIPAEQRAAFVQAARREQTVESLVVAAQPLAKNATPNATPIDTLPLPSGTVTFLFTDIEGSTQLWERHSQAMRGALARHDSILRQVIEAHAGTVVKTVGDGFRAAFATTSDALRAAMEAQRTLAAEVWDETGPLQVRMALHTGTAELRDGDYFGTTLNRTARLVAAGHGGQILLSLAAAELVREQLPPETELSDLGLHRLKDLSLPERIFQLLAPDSPSEFPPLNTLDARRTNLPAQPTALVGRAHEVSAVTRLLRQDTVRLVTLTGPGGVGKTRLSLQAAAELLDHFANGVYFVDLAPIREPNLVTSAIAATLGVRENGGQPLLAALKDYLREKQVLLLLDNFEQVLDAATAVADLLATARRLKVMVTSREILHLRGEKDVPVEPLALPDPRHLPALEELSQYAAVALFIERALDARPDFEVTNANAPAVAEICALLDGLPLALELAAARTKLFPPEALLKRLGSRLPFLTSGPRDLPARQQTIRSTIDWSYDLLDASEQTLFARLSIFVGGCTLDAAEAVCNAAGDLPMDVVDGLAALIDQSLLRQQNGPGGEPRFLMLETIREYALDCLAANGERDLLRQQHAAYFLALAEAAEPHLQELDQVAWLNRLEADYDNLHAVWTWSQAAVGNADLGVQLGAALWRFWLVRRPGKVGIWLERALERSTGAVPPVTAAIRAKVLAAAGMIAYWQDDYARARTLMEESQALYREAGNPAGLAEVLVHLGRGARNQGDYVRASRLQEEGLALYRGQGDTWGTAFALMSLGDVALDQGDTALAAARSQDALALFRSVGDREDSAWALLNLGRATYAQDDRAPALAVFEETLALFREMGHRDGVAQVLLELARVACVQGDNARAEVLFGESLALCQEEANARDMAHCLAGLAGVAAVSGQPERAARLLGIAEALRESAGMPLPPINRADYERDVAAARARLGDAAFAAAWEAGRALTLEQAIAYALEGTEASIATPAPQ